MSKKQKRILYRCIAAAVLLAGAIVLRSFLPHLPFYVHLLFFLPAYFTVGADVLWEAVTRIFRGRLFDEAFLMTVATVGALVIGEYPEAVFVMLFFRVGELFEGLATRHARASLSALAAFVPDTARVVLAEGGEEMRDAEDVPVGSLIRVLPGERVPLDARVTSGAASLDLSALTGEALPVDAAVGTELPAGAICLDGVLLLRTVREAEESTAARILEMVENATDRKAHAESFITRFARVYTPIVCALALLTAVVLWLLGVSPAQSIYVALSFLVISCPCALVISVPLAFFAGVGCGAGCGILFKGSRELERLASVGGAAFDKTGTLTTGDFVPTEFFLADGVEREELFLTAATVEAASNHPLARSIVRAYMAEHPDAILPPILDVNEVTGGGVGARLGGESVFVGKPGFLEAQGICVPTLSTEGAVICVARAGKYLGAIAVSDRVREDTPDAIDALRRAGISPLVLLSGDRAPVAAAVGKALSLDCVHAECTPADKARILSEERARTGRRLLFVGDGINDAPALASSDCGMAMGALGTDAAKYAADVVLLRDGLGGAADAILIARKTVRIVRTNIVFILAVKAAVMLLSAFSLVGMWAAVFADVGVSVISILNAMRAGRAVR